MTRLLRPALALGLGVALAVSGSALAAPKAAPRVTTALGPNLVPNPGFEASSNDTATDNAVPVTPVSWAFEGATILFDYNKRGPHSGTRLVAISGSLAPGGQVCDASSGSYKCVTNPAAPATGAVNDAALPYSSVRPFWKTAAPVPVTAGQSYRFGMFSQRPSLDPNAGVDGEGAATKVRWVNAAGSTLSVADGPEARKTAKREIGYRFSSKDLVAPEGAVGATLLLGHTDYTVTSAQIAFDDISFQQILKK